MVALHLVSNPIGWPLKYLSAHQLQDFYHALLRYKLQFAVSTSNIFIRLVLNSASQVLRAW